MNLLYRSDQVRYSWKRVILFCFPPLKLKVSSHQLTSATLHESRCITWNNCSSICWGEPRSRTDPEWIKADVLVRRPRIPRKRGWPLCCSVRVIKQAQLDAESASRNALDQASARRCIKYRACMDAVQRNYPQCNENSDENRNTKSH